MATNCTSPAAEDQDARELKAQIIRDYDSGKYAGEQINIIAYSGGAAVAANAAILLKRFRPDIQINNVVTLGGVHCKSMPSNVTNIVNIIGTLDPLAKGWNTRDPYNSIYFIFSDHWQYFTSQRDAVLYILRWIGLR